MLLRFKAVVLKEFRHIVRDWQTLTIVLCMPVAMMFLYGYALNMELTDVPVAVVDPELSVESGRIAASLDATDFFSVPIRQAETGNPEEFFRRYHVKAIVRFPGGFSRSLGSAAGASLQVLIDGTDPNTATILGNTVEGVIRKVLMEGVPEEMVPKGVSVTRTVLYNPEQKSAKFFVPGLMAVILLMISAMLTSLTLTREKESGTIEQLLVSPLRSFEIVVGKIIPYCLLAVCDGIIIILVGYFVFGVYCDGSLLLLTLLSILYIVTALAVGLVISIVAANQQQAMMIVIPATMLPTIILSGFIFPLTSLPAALRAVSSIVPATWYLKIIRGIMLKGAGISYLHHPVLILSCMAVVFTMVAVKRFRLRL